MIDAETATLAQRRLLKHRVTSSVAVVPISLFLLGATSTALYFWGRDLHRFTQWLAAFIGLFIAQLGLYLIACFVVVRRLDHSPQLAKWAAIAAIILFAAASRAVLVPQRPYLSTDVYRYVWDGYVQRAGINPYRFVPEANELAGLRDNRIYPNINPEDKRWYTPYPPIAQFVFAAISRIAPLSVTAFKAVISSFDLITTLLLMVVLARTNIDPARAIIFAWHPLAIFEGAHSGHLEAIYITCLALVLFAWSSSRRNLTGIPLATAALVKFYPALLLPAVLRAGTGSYKARETSEPNRSSLRQSIDAVLHKQNVSILLGFLATVIFAYAVYWGSGGNSFWFLRGYVEQEGFVESGARYFLLDAARKVVWIPTIVFLSAGAIVLIVVAVRQLRKPAGVIDLARGSLALIGTYLLLTTPRYAWYYIWLVPFLCFEPRMSWLYVTCASALLYLVWYTPLVYPGVPVWLGMSIYIPAIAWLMIEQAGSSRSRV